MAKSALRVRQGDVAFYLNEASDGSRGGRRYYLYRTSQHGKVKDGRVQIGSTTGQALMGIGNEVELFKACQEHFDGKRQRAYQPQAEIRGPAGRWEGKAFPARKSHTNTHKARLSPVCNPDQDRNGEILPMSSISVVQAAEQLSQSMPLAPLPSMSGEEDYCS